MKISTEDFILSCLEKVLPGGVSMERHESVISSDGTTLFVTAGMQRFKKEFENQSGRQAATIQSCLRTNDIESVGDGSHLTYFRMLGTFAFGGHCYEDHCRLWLTFLRRILGSAADSLIVHYHPASDFHKFWLNHGIELRPDNTCEWSDGSIKGYCSELYLGSLELGNLVAPLSHSVDVGFGLERLVQVLEGATRVDETSIYNQSLSPVSRDHVRALESLYRDNVYPSNVKRGYVTRRLLRRVIRETPNELLQGYNFYPWVEPERVKLLKAIAAAEKVYSRRRRESDFFWWESYGLLPEDILQLKDSLDKS